MFVERQLVPCARASGSEGSVTEDAVLTWHMADASLRGPQGSPSGNSNQLTVASKDDVGHRKMMLEMLRNLSVK